MNDVWWPLTFDEMASGWLKGGPVIKVHHIASYAYPAGTRSRYTPEGWELWKQIAIRDGIAIPVNDL